MCIRDRCLVSLNIKSFMRVKEDRSYHQLSSIPVILRSVSKWLSKNQNKSNLLRPVKTRENSAWTNQNFCNLIKARERSRIERATCFGFASYRLKNWRDIFKPITSRSNRNRESTFDSHLITALISGVLGAIITFYELNINSSTFYFLWILYTLSICWQTKR